MLEVVRPPHGAARRGRGAPLLAAAGLAALLFVLMRRNADHTAQPARNDTATEKAQAESSRWPKRRVIKDLETLWEVPHQPRGVLFVAHGCSHSGSDWWPPSQRCQHCLGLPEEMIVRRAAVERGYAVIAVSSFDRETKCWHNTAASRSEDLQRVPDILRAVMKEEGLSELPLLSFGASSGGSFALRVGALMPEVKGVVSQITPVNPSIFKGLDRPFPPTIFVHMAERDPSKAETVAAALGVLKESGTPAAEIRVGPRPCTPEFLQRSPLIPQKMARSIVDALTEAGLLDEGGYFIEDPRRTGKQWRDLLKPLVGELSLEADVSQVAELFNVAYARHELIGDTTDVSLAWLEAGGKADIDELQRQEAERREGKGR
ncbi:hypothetical protein ABPG77_009556 [Micractinium sp. CCAP 211/92]